MISSTLPSPLTVEYKLSNENGEVFIIGSVLLIGLGSFSSFLTIVVIGPGVIFILLLIVGDTFVSNLSILITPFCCLLVAPVLNSLAPVLNSLAPVLNSLAPVLNSLTISSNLLSLLTDFVGDTNSVLSYACSITGSVISFNIIFCVAFFICASSGSPSSLYGSGNTSTGKPPGSSLLNMFEKLLSTTSLPSVTSVPSVTSTTSVTSATSVTSLSSSVSY